MELRQYQSECIESLYNDLKRGFKRLCVSLPTGSGKSLVMASLCARAIAKNKRILVLAHQSELLEQNENELLQILPQLDTGIVCAKLDRKEFNKSVVFASRDSLGRNPTSAGQFDLILIDECHLLNVTDIKEDADGNYARILKAQKPTTIIIGLTATPFRKRELIYNRAKIKDRFFEKLSFQITQDELTRQGHLSRMIFPEYGHETIINADNIKIDSTGDYNIPELESISMTDLAIYQCLESWNEHANDRKLSLFFCCSIKHAEAVMLHLKTRDISCAYIDGNTPTAEREQIIEKAKAGNYKALVNVNVLTTGVNIRNIDCIVLLRATRSPSLFVQMIGRGSRLSADKKDFLVLDMAGNFERFGDCDNPNLRGNEKKERALAGVSEEKKGSIPKKECPQCAEKCYASQTKCYGCDFVFFNHSSGQFYTGESREVWKKVSSISVAPHITKAGERGWMRMEFSTYENKSNHKYFLYVSPYDSPSKRIYDRLRPLFPPTFSVFGFKLPIEILVKEGKGASDFVENVRMSEFNQMTLG